MGEYYTYELHDSDSLFIPFYVGKGKGNRCEKHIPKAIAGRHINKHLQNTINKILREGREVKVYKVIENVDEQTALDTEKEIIKGYRESGIELCNLTDGGEGISGCKLNFTEEHKKRISEATRRQIVNNGHPSLGRCCSEETKKKIGDANKVKIRTEDFKKRLSEMKTGLKHSKEAKRKMSESHTGHKTSEETKKKISESKKGCVFTEEAKQNMSNAQKGNDNALGHKVSIESRKKMSEGVKRARNKIKINKEKSDAA